MNRVKVIVTSACMNIEMKFSNRYNFGVVNYRKKCGEQENMFGYIICNKTELTREEQLRYQHFYCGLCRALKRKYGQAARFSLNYDMTFLALLLSALYEPEESIADFRCMVHPLERRLEIRNPYIEYAADMTILLTHYKCMDDWNDEKKAGKRLYAGILNKYTDTIMQNYPRQYEMVKRSRTELTDLENRSENVSDEIVKYCGNLIAEIFVYDEQDHWGQRLRNFGYELGRFIYLMDAVIDYESDLKSGSYNPFLKKSFNRERIREILNVMIGNAMEEFECLPIVRDEGILKNILYRGVWSQYNMKISGKDK